MFEEVLNTPIFRFGPGSFLHNHNKHLTAYFEFLYFPLNISEKLHWQHLFENLEESETHRLHLC